MAVPALPVIGSVPSVELFQTLEWLALVRSCVGITCSSSGVLRSASTFTAGNCMQEQQDPKAASAQQLPQIREDCVPVHGKVAVCVHIPSSVQDAQNSQWLW